MSDPLRKACHRSYACTSGLRVFIFALFLGLGCCLAQASYAQAPDAVNRDDFASPPQNVRPLIRWWWPGGDVSDTELTRELEVMSQAGFGGAEIQSFAVGLPSSAPSSVYTYGTGSWFDHLAAAVNAAQAVGMKIDLTLGSAWPSGGAEIQDPLSALFAVRLADDQTQDQPLTAPTLSGLPALPPTAYLDPTSVTNLSSYVLPDPLHPLGVLEWTAPAGKWVVFAFYQGPTELRTFYGADAGTPLVLDHFNENAIDTYLQAVAGNAATRLGSQFGTVLQSLFVDSLELRTELYWTDDFLAQFYQRRGYALQPFLPVLFRPLADDRYLSKLYPGAGPTFDIHGVGARARQDVAQTVSELMIERFYTPIRQWADAHNVKARIQAHGSPTDLIASYGKATIPESEGLYAGGSAAFLRMAASAAHLSGAPIVSSEVLDFQGAPPVLPSTILAEANRNFAAGVNQLVLHGFPYVYDSGFNWPGWMPFTSPYLPGKSVIGTFGTALNDRNPIWRFFPSVNAYISRGQLFTRYGSPVETVALFTGALGYPDDPSVPVINQQLSNAGYNYDYVNGNALLGATVNQGALQIGSNTYSVLVIPALSSVSPEVAQKIVSLVQSSLPLLIVGDIPSQASGYNNAPVNDGLVQAAFQQLLGTTRASALSAGKVSQGTAEFISDATTAGATLLNDLNISPDLNLQGHGQVLSYVHRKSSTADYYFIADTGGTSLDVQIPFANPAGRIPEIWDFESGQVTSALVYTTTGGTTTISLHFDPGTAVAVGFDHTGIAPFHVENSGFVSISTGPNGVLIGMANQPGTYQVTINGGLTESVTISAPSLPALPVPTWDIVASTISPSGSTGSQTLSKVSLTDLSTAVQNFGDWADYAAYVDFTPLNPAYLSSNVHLILDLGVVNDIAEVKVNGQSVGVLMSAPYGIDISKYLVSGTNKIEVAVTTAPGQTPAGMLGPVQLTPAYVATIPGFGTLHMSVVITPINFPNNTLQDMYNAIDEASKFSNRVDFQWFWKQPPSTQHPNGGATTDCSDVGLWVQRARADNLRFTLQFQTFYAQVNGSYGGALNAGATGSIPDVRLAVPFDTFQTASFSDPTIQQAYLVQIACLAKLQPDYLVLGPEVNFVAAFNPSEWLNFIPVYRRAYALAKSISPLTQVGLSYQYDGLRRDYMLYNNNWNLINAAGPQDFIGMTSYFGYSDDNAAAYATPSAIPLDYYAPIRQVLGNLVPVVFTEIGWSSYYSNGLDTQQQFLRALPFLLKSSNADFIKGGLERSTAA